MTQTNTCVRRIFRRAGEAALLAGILLAVSAVEASVVYTYTAAPVTISTRGNGGPAAGFTSNIAPQGSANASLTFTNALAPNTTTIVSAETGGYDFVGSPSSGGVVGFSASGLAPPGISSLLSAYDLNNGSDPNAYRLIQYATVEGSVSTDAAGAIFEWDLNYQVFFLNNPIFFSKTSTLSAAPSDFGINRLSQGVVLSSTSQSLNLTNLVAVDNDISVNSITGNYFDLVRGVNNSVLDFRYTTQSGAFSSNASNPTPAPALGALLLLGVFALAQRKTRRIAI